MALPASSETRSGKAVATGEADKAARSHQALYSDACGCESHRRALGETQGLSCTSVFGRDSSLCDTDKPKKEKERR